MHNAIPVYTPQSFDEYELIDSGDGLKLERFGTYTVSRPEPHAIWQKSAPENVWNNADAVYHRTSDSAGTWEIRKNPPHPWTIRYKHLSFILKPTTFKHVGVFPEQAPNWDFLMQTIHSKPLRILNLFAYTGGATLACLSTGAHVTHVDASKPSLTWARENAEASKLIDKPVRWIFDDAYKFVLREQRRGNTYDGIIMDPPHFGRGAKGEVWKLTHDLPKLLAACKTILSDTPALFLLNAYTVDLSAIAVSRLTHELMGGHGTHEFGELCLKETASKKLLPCGIFARWRAS